MTYTAPFRGHSLFTSRRRAVFHLPALKAVNIYRLPPSANDTGSERVLLNAADSDEVPFSEWVMRGIAASSPAQTWSLYQCTKKCLEEKKEIGCVSVKVAHRNVKMKE